MAIDRLNDRGMKEVGTSFKLMGKEPTKKEIEEAKKLIEEVKKEKQ